MAAKLGIVDRRAGPGSSARRLPWPKPSYAYCQLNHTQLSVQTGVGTDLGQPSPFVSTGPVACWSQTWKRMAAHATCKRDPWPP